MKIIIALILAGVLAFFGITIKSCGILQGSGGRGGSGLENSTSTNESVSDKSDSSKENQVSEIRIEGDKIYFDNELCADENELKQKITDIGTNREYVFVQDHAIKGTYDKVDAVLSELKKALGITINRE